MLLAIKPNTTSATPSRCGKSFRAKRSVLGHARQRCSRPAVTASGGISIAWAQCGQASSVESELKPIRAFCSQDGQLKVTFMFRTKSQAIPDNGRLSKDPLPGPQLGEGPAEGLNLLL